MTVEQATMTAAPLATPTASRAQGGSLPADLWATIQSSIPIVCVDIVPVLLDSRGDVTHVGFIRRANPFGDEHLWCHVGGRVHLDETLAAAIRRHLDATLTGTGDVHIGADPQPEHVMQYLRRPNPDLAGVAGTDPRKHAIALTYVLAVPAHVTAVDGGEGSAFGWVPAADVPLLGATWPGSLIAVEAALDTWTSRRQGLTAR